MIERPLRLLVSEDELVEVVKRLSVNIATDYHDKNPLFVGVLRGAFVFLSDLVRCLSFPLAVEFVSIASYSGMQRHEGLAGIEGLTFDVKGRHVIIVEDIIDTGLTVTKLRGALSDLGAPTVGVCSLCSKDVCHEVPVQIDYLGVSVPNVFIVGYGMDYRQEFRNLRELYYMDYVE